MAASPQFKVYSATGEYVAACRYVEDAAAIVANYAGGTIRNGHAKRHTVWRESIDGWAAESYDAVVQHVFK